MWGGVAHAKHEFRQRRPGRSGQGVGSVSQIVEGECRTSRYDSGSTKLLAEHVGSKRATLLADKHGRITTHADKVRQVVLDRTGDRGGKRHGATPGLGLGRVLCQPTFAVSPIGLVGDASSGAPYGASTQRQSGSYGRVGSHTLLHPERKRA